MSARATDKEREEMIDETLADTFPASDPPSWTLGREPHPREQATQEVSLVQEEDHLIITRSEKETQTLRNHQEGTLTDTDTQTAIKRLLDALVQWTRRLQRSRD